MICITSGLITNPSSLHVQSTCFRPKLQIMRLTYLKLGLLLSLAASAHAQLEVVATGLAAPQKLILTARGNFLVTETSPQPNQGRISFVSRAGTRRSLVERLPSGIEVAGGASGPTAMALSGRTLYVAIGGGDAERRTSTGTLIHNPEGISSPIFVSILEFRFNQDVDQIGGTFQMTAPQQLQLSDGEEISMSDGSGASATVRILARFPQSLPEGAGYRFSNPWGLALSDDAATLWVIDASQNSLARVDVASGRWRRIMRFAPSPNPTPIGPPVVEAVPTGIRVYGDQLLISFLSGFPFAPGQAKVLAVNPDAKTFEPFINGLTSSTDVLWRARGAGQRTQFFALEFSVNQRATPPPPGRLLRFDGLDPVVVASDLRAPVSLALDSVTEELFILELSGRILKTSVR
jgi:hypothetical protein